MFIGEGINKCDKQLHQSPGLKVPGQLGHPEHPVFRMSFKNSDLYIIVINKKLIYKQDAVYYTDMRTSTYRNLKESSLDDTIVDI